MGALWNSQADKVCIGGKGEQVGNVDDHLDVDNDIVKGGGDDLQGGDRVGDGPQL